MYSLRTLSRVEYGHISQRCESRNGVAGDKNVRVLVTSRRDVRVEIEQPYYYISGRKVTSRRDVRVEMLSLPAALPPVPPSHLAEM